MNWKEFISLIKDEFGCNNVKDIKHKDGKWIIEYCRNDLPDDEFDGFDDVIQYLKTEGNE